MKKLRKDNDDKRETINHLLLQLNSVKGGQDYEMWLVERREKNRIIAQLMQQIAELEKDPHDKEPLYAQIQILKCKVTKLKIEKDEIARRLADLQQPQSDGEGSGLSDGGKSPVVPRSKRASSPSKKPRAFTEDSGDIVKTRAEERKPLGLSNEIQASPTPSRRSRRISAKLVIRKLSSAPDGTNVEVNTYDKANDNTDGNKPSEQQQQPTPIPTAIATSSSVPSSPSTSKRSIASSQGKKDRPYKTLAVKPSIKTKNLNWSTIAPHKIDNTIWEKTNESNIVFDTEMLEKMFRQNRVQSKATAKRYGSMTKISVVEFTRANNIGVLLAPFKGGITEVKNSILELNENILTQETTANLLLFIPTKEELQIISEYSGDPSCLGKAELYFKEISEIPRLENRLLVHLFSLKYPEFIDELRPDLRCVIQAATSVRESKKLCKILEIVLAVGNFLNDNTAKGNAFGFRLESLKKLKETRAADGSTLLHFMSQMINVNYPELWDWDAELCHLEHAAKVSWTNVNEVMKSISSGVQLVAQEIVLANDPQDKYSGLLASLSALCAGEYDEVVKEAAEAEKAMLDIAAFYGEPPLASGVAPSPDIIFGILSSFLDELARARHDCHRRAQLNSSLSSSSSSLSSFKNKGEKGGVEDVTATIRRGQLFKERRKTPLGSFSTSAPSLVLPPSSPVLNVRTIRSHSVVDTAHNPPPSPTTLISPHSLSQASLPMPSFSPRSWISRK